MAKSFSINEISGTIGELTFIRTNGRNYVRRKSSLTIEKMLSNPRSEMTFKNANEFKNCSLAGKYLRQTLQPLITIGRDNTHHNRLLKLLRSIINTDSVNKKGKRTINAGNYTMLKDFNFNYNAPFTKCLSAEYEATIDKSIGEFKLVIPSFNPEYFLSYPAAATHFKVLSMGCELDFTNGDNTTDLKESPIYPILGNDSITISHRHNITPNTDLAAMLAASIQYYQQVNNRYYLLENNEFNSTQILQVE